MRQPQPLLGRFTCGRIQIAGEAKFFTVNLGYDIAGFTKATDERWSIDHYERGVTVDAQERL